MPAWYALVPLPFLPFSVFLLLLSGWAGINPSQLFSSTPSTADSLKSAATERPDPFGQFPLPSDPFRFVPCTNKSLPPPINDPNPRTTWAAQFDPDPGHWSWGHASTDNTNDDPYFGRGVYLCGYLDVPMDYSNEQDSRIVRLAVTKYQVSGLARLDKHGSRLSASAGRKSERTIVIQPGGPGGSGTMYVWEAAESVSNRFSDGEYDVLGWDPRGVNISLPSVSCFPDDIHRDHWTILQDQYREMLPVPSAHIRTVNALNNATLFNCNVLFGDLGRFLSTTTVARDLEEIRGALNETLTGYFVSYGTGIAQTYFNMFSNNVGRLILDGTEYVPDHRVIGGWGVTSLDNATDAWRDGFLRECIQAGPDHCALATPMREAKPAMTLPDLESRMEKVLKRLIAQPIPARTDASGPVLITYSALVFIIYISMYDPRKWKATAKMLHELESGNWTLAANAIAYNPDLNGPPRHPKTAELPYLVICADAYDSRKPAGALEWWDQLWNNMTTDSWLSGNSRFYIVFWCRHFSEHWLPPTELYRGSLSHNLNNPVLLIAETHDPATPLRNGKRLLDDMGQNARLIVHHGYGHTSRWHVSNCTDSIAKSYMLHNKLPDTAETHCYTDTNPFLKEHRSW